MVPRSTASKNGRTENISKSDTSSASIIRRLQEAVECSDKNLFRRKMADISNSLNAQQNLGTNVGSGYLPLKNDLAQIVGAHTTERAKYYARRLIKSLSETKTNGINEINLYRWKEYDDIITDSLWTFDRRDSSGTHLGWYWGNFVPQIPHQFLLRFTKKGDWVLDPFAGSGTTLIECVRLGRNVIGVEINRDTVRRAISSIKKEQNTFGTKFHLEQGDSTKINMVDLCERYGTSKVQLVILHPPYFNIIKFSKDSRDLSNSNSIKDFLDKFGIVVRNTYPVLEDGRYLVLVAGDKFQKGEWIPLGFYMMEEVMKNGFKLTGIIAKNFEDTRSKREQKELWRYRALAGGFYVFKHEYIFVFRKKSSGADRV